MRHGNSVLGLVVVLFGVHVAAAAQGWPEFRGPHGDGRCDAKGLPLTWSETENVAWKTPIPFEGWSTPVAMDGQIWLTTATPDGKDFFVICVDAATGQIVFNEMLFHSDNPEPLDNAVNCYASPSLVMEPGRVYVHFGSYGTACLDTASKLVVWKRTDLPCRHYRGPGSSPILFENLLVLTFDGVDVQYTAALDKATGETVWKTDRSTVWTDLDENGQPKREGDFRKAFSTPIVVTAGGTAQLVSLGSSAFFGYDARTGKELWKLPNTAYSPASRPVYGKGLIYAITGRGGNSELYAVRPDGQGDLTDAQVAWKFGGPGVPTEPSVLLVDDLLYMVGNNGTLTCLEAGTGTQVWSERLGGNYLASPICAEGRIYLFSTQGKTTVVKAGRAYEALATNVLDNGFMASPAVLDKALILRTKTDLYRIEVPQT
ncbi:MAG: PQQ-binding-like beta-propeller repeat protein [FCB group bacterium]|jgi:outer membrane protein assembly factor BamB|nr:PQQ-binding-like beta-propeller repeat protein [FCB group bacterium]